MREPVEYRRACPQNGRLRDGMGAILGYARVSTGDQDVAGQTMRLTQVGAIKVFSDIRSGKTSDRASKPCSPTPARAIRSQSCVSTGSDDLSANC